MAHYIRYIINEEKTMFPCDYYFAGKFIVETSMTIMSRQFTIVEREGVFVTDWMSVFESEYEGNRYWLMLTEISQHDHHTDGSIKAVHIHIMERSDVRELASRFLGQWEPLFPHPEPYDMNIPAHLQDVTPIDGYASYYARVWELPNFVTTTYDAASRLNNVAALPYQHSPTQPFHDLSDDGSVEFGLG